MASSIRKILQKFISDRIPQKQTNIFWQMFNGIEAMFTQLEYFLKIRKRESNMLTANYLSSLRNHAAIFIYISFIFFVIPIKLIII